MNASIATKFTNTVKKEKATSEARAREEREQITKR